MLYGLMSMIYFMRLILVILFFSMRMMTITIFKMMMMMMVVMLMVIMMVVMIMMMMLIMIVTITNRKHCMFFYSVHVLPYCRVVFYRSGASGHQVLRLQFNGTFPTGEEILRAYHRANARIYIYIYEEFLQNNHESDESDDEEDRDDDIVFLPNVQSTPQQERGNRDLLPNGQSTPQQDRGNRQVPNSNADREELRGTDMEGGEERAVENLHDGREESQEQQHENMENNSDDMEVDRELQEAPTGKCP